MATQVLTNSYDVESQDETSFSLAGTLRDINRVLETRNADKNSNSVTQKIVKPRYADNSADLNSCEDEAEHTAYHASSIRSLSLYPVNPKPFKRMRYTQSVRTVATTHQTYLYDSLSLDCDTDVLAN